MGRAEEESKERKEISSAGSNSGLRRNMVPGKTSRIQLKLARVERVPELAIYYNQIGDYPNRHHRTFIQQLMESDKEIHTQALD